MTFKVGDRVRIKDGLHFGEIRGGIYVNKSMSLLCGEVVAITREMYSGKYEDIYKVSGNPYTWYAGMLEKIPSDVSCDIAELI